MKFATKAIHAGQHVIKHRQRVLSGQRSLHSLISVVHCLDSIAFRFEILCYQLAEFSVVVDDQNLLHRQILSSEFNVYVAVPVSVPLAVLTRRQQAEV